MTDAFGKALQAITEDGDAAFLFSQRDFGSLGNDHGLDDHEQDLLQAAAEEVNESDDVAGFQFRPDRDPASFIKLGDIKGEAVGRRFREATDYYRYELKN